MTGSRRITWLHVSDFHVGMDGYGQRKLFSEITDYVGQQVDNGYTSDFIFLTGDIANKGLSQEYVDFSRAFEKVLVFADDAHSLADELLKLIFGVRSRILRNVHFLLCSRTIDWRDEIRNVLQIIANSTYQEIALRGVSDTDAKQMVDTWALYGKEGLGELYALPREEAVERLKEIAIGESGNSDEGVLLGAMLRVRYGHRLKDKVRSILYKLMEVRGPKGTLLDAYAMIAVMHAEGLRFLSAPVLSEVLGCSTADLRRKVLNPLADEAVAAGGGRFILSRHKAIAEASIAVIQESNLYGDLEGLFPELAEAALRARAMGQFVPDLDKWDYQLPGYFLQSERPLLAVSVAKVLQETDPLDIRLRVNLSKIYREVRAVDKSVELFRAYSGELNRIAYTEWSVAEGYAGNSAAAAVISAAAICDLPGVVPPTRDAGRSAMGLTLNLRRLYEQYGEKVFLNGALAIAEIGLRFANDELTKQYLIDFMM